MRLVHLVLAAGLFALPASAQRSDVGMFPQAQRGDERIVIRLKPKQNESSMRVELVAGSIIKIDCNSHSLGRNLAEKTLEGWGYTFWTVTQMPTVTTLMGCPQGSNRTVFVSGEAQLVPYNSRLPIVAYVPKGYQLRYRIWSAITPAAIAPKG